MAARHEVDIPGPAPRLHTALPTCEYYPVSLDPRAHTISFARITRQTYRDSGFLIPRGADLGNRLFTYNLDDFLLSSRSLKGGTPAHYILISAFCCSTLLARYFDLLRGCLVLREPGILGQLAILRNAPDMNEANRWRAEWLRLADAGLRLLTRPLASTDSVIVKAADVCNNLGTLLLDRDRTTKIVLLSVNLRTFILSVLKSDGRREWMRQRARFWRREARAEAIVPLFDPDLLDDACKGAYLWLATKALWEDLARRVPAERLLALDGDDVASSPRETVRAAAGFFGLTPSAAEFDAIAGSATSGRHAKHPKVEYGAETRRRDVAAWQDRFGAEVDRAVEWAHRVYQRSTGRPLDERHCAA